jgi:hypothetical protein
MWRALFIALALFVALFGVFYFVGGHSGGEPSGVLSTTAWQRMALPGELSQAHAFLEHNCAACHTAVEGVKASNCIVCHANNESLLQRQPTSFHASISSCKECHLEHQGRGSLATNMDHVVLAEIGLRQLKDDDVDSELLTWSKLWVPPHAHITPEETVLNCATCHSNDDRHFQLFGQDCAQCHATDRWTIAEFRHPSPSSMDCVQCHQAPPSHYMMHFKMISMTTAGVEKAEVNQCFLCHQTTSWNDIKGVGFYKHH